MYVFKEILYQAAIELATVRNTAWYIYFYTVVLEQTPTNLDLLVYLFLYCGTRTDTY